MFRDSRMAEVLPPEGELITDLDKLVHTMGQVALAAHEIGLPQFRYGFRGYELVTHRVVEALVSGAFDHPDKMEQTMPFFAKRAFDPMRHYINGETDKIGAWSPMFFAPSSQRAHPSIAMVDFLSVHVNHDLPYTLIETDTQPKHKRDYSQEINLILSEAGRQLLPEYVKVHPPLRWLRVQDVGLNLVLSSLFKARDNAWNSYEELQAVEAMPLELQPDARRQIDAKLSQRAANRMLSQHKVADFVVRHVNHPSTAAWELPEAA